MSGHSKWAQIKRQKGIADVKRGAAFTKFSNTITLAVKQGGGIGDPDQNFKLRLAIDRARSINMPKDTIERAISKGMGKGGENVLEEATYEGFAPGGISVIVEAVTDKKIRTTSEIQNIFNKSGANMGVPGSVAYQYETKGLITMKKGDKSLDDIFLIAADAGAEDVEDADEDVLVYTKAEELATVATALKAQGFEVSLAELTRKPLTTVRVEDPDTARKILSLVDKLENHDDVSKVYANFDIPDALIS